MVKKKRKIVVEPFDDIKIIGSQSVLSTLVIETVSESILQRSAIFTRCCSMVSRLRRVTVWSSSD